MAPRPSEITAEIAICELLKKAGLMIGSCACFSNRQNNGPRITAQSRNGHTLIDCKLLAIAALSKLVIPIANSVRPTARLTAPAKSKGLWSSPRVPGGSKRHAPIISTIAMGTLIRNSHCHP